MPERYLCIDPRYQLGTPSQKIADLYYGMRYVLFQDIWDITANYINSGWYVQGVVARESINDDWNALNFFADWAPPNFDIIIGNEPDSSGGASWTMTPDEYGALWQATSNYQAPRWIAGMTSGDVALAAQYVARAPGAAGLMIHLYGLSPSRATAKVNEYKKIGLPVRVGEWHAANGYRHTSYSFSVPANDFCWSDAMVPGFGLYQ